MTDEHYKNMPAFHQPKQEPFACVNLRFANEADLAAFAKLTGVKLTPKTKSAWFPDKEPSGVGSKRWR